ncbi:MAG: hypothetical protein H0U28_11025, partial [Nocardioidaceae bacterium]|nr:hypothetical protein [Nocardioidaceae bacterium]
TLLGTLLATAIFTRRRGLVLRAHVSPRPHVDVMSRGEYAARREVAVAAQAA